MVLFAYLRLLILLLAILILICASSSLVFHMMYSAFKLNKQGDNILPWRTPFPIWNLLFHVQFYPFFPCTAESFVLLPQALHCTPSPPPNLIFSQTSYFYQWRYLAFHHYISHIYFHHHHFWPHAAYPVECKVSCKGIPLCHFFLYSCVPFTLVIITHVSNLSFSFKAFPPKL